MFHNSIIQVENVQRHLPQGGRELHILNGVSFDVEAGSWLALTGPSGSGKSTLLGILGGIDKPSSGRVFIEGIEISAMPEARLSRLREVAAGKSNHEIAATLVISEKTVKTHITNILTKLHLSDRTQAAVFAWQEGIVRRDKN